LIAVPDYHLWERELVRRKLLVQGDALLRLFAVRVKNWENDILGDDVLGSGKATEININDERTTCNYDFQAKFADGDVVEKYNIDICKLGGGSYQFYD
jgi:hypothetical protein